MSKETPAKMGRPNIEDQDQLKPRFTINMSDHHYEKFEKAVRKSSLKRSEFARRAILKAVEQELINE